MLTIGMNEDSRTTQSPATGDAPGIKQAVALCLTNNPPVSPTPSPGLPANGEQAEAYDEQREDAILVHAAEFVERMEAKLGPVACRRGTPRANEGIRKPRKPRRSVSPRHAGRCKVCNHPDREDIEHDFLRWRDPEIISRVYDIANKSSIYRHARATGLLARRRRNLRALFESIYERVDEARISADAIFRSLPTYARITEAGELLEAPPKRVHVVHEYCGLSAASPSLRTSPALPAPSSAEGSAASGSKSKSRSKSQPRRRRPRSSPRHRSTIVNRHRKSKSK
jgi:hypothetical protein